jgi:glycerol-3-phosphate cytidylyltransferase-like family protein
MDYPGSAAKEGAFVPKGAEKVVEAANEAVRKAETKKDEPIAPTQTEKEVVKDSNVVADVVAKHDKEVKENMKEAKKEVAEKAAEKKAEDQKLKDDTAKFSGLPVEKKEEAAEVKDAPAEAAAPVVAKPAKTET